MIKEFKMIEEFKEKAKVIDILGVDRYLVLYEFGCEHMKNPIQLNKCEGVLKNQFHMELTNVSTAILKLCFSQAI